MDTGKLYGGMSAGYLLLATIFVVVSFSFFGDESVAQAILVICGIVATLLFGIFGMAYLNVEFVQS